MIGLAVSPLLAGGKGSVTGAYVEARTAEVFTGGCIMNSEAETMGKQAVLAWKVDRGSFNGIAIDGLSVVAALSGDRESRHAGNGRRQAVGPIGVVRRRARERRAAARARRDGQRAVERHRRDDRASGARADSVHRHGSEIEVTAGQVTLDVNKHLTHEPTCGAMQWFHPLAQVDDAAIGVAAQHLFTGAGARHQVERSEQALGVLRNILD